MYRHKKKRPNMIENMIRSVPHDVVKFTYDDIHSWVFRDHPYLPLVFPKWEDMILTILNTEGNYFRKTHTLNEVTFYVIVKDNAYRQYVLQKMRQHFGANSAPVWATSIALAFFVLSLALLLAVYLMWA